jgi:hypothetical protein
MGDQQMKRFAFVGILCAATWLTACEDNRLIPLLSLRSGSVSVGGAVRARSAHFKILGTTRPSGGPHNSQMGRLDDGAFVNGQHLPGKSTTAGGEP